jgi:hypothetical protein
VVDHALVLAVWHVASFAIILFGTTMQAFPSELLRFVEGEDPLRGKCNAVGGFFLSFVEGLIVSLF